MNKISAFAIFLTVSAMYANAATPEKLYMHGNAAPGKNLLRHAPELTKVNANQFRYTGSLYRGELDIRTAQSSSATIYAPNAVGGWLIYADGEGSKITTSGEKYWVNETGTYDIFVTFADNSDIPVVKATRTGKLKPVKTDVDRTGTPPMGWNPYKKLFTMEATGVPYHEQDVTSEEWNAALDMMASMKPYGYDMIITDGFLPQTSQDGTGYMTHFGSISLAELARRCKERGLRLGVYDNCLWLKKNDNSYVPGTAISYSSLVRNENDVVAHPEIQDNNGFCYWLVTDHNGAKDYIDGWFKHYADLGVEYVFMDFMDWYENGYDEMRGYVSCGYGRERFELGLSYMAEAAKKYGIMTSCGLSWHYNHSELESQYFHIMRVERDLGNGGWDHVSQCGVNAPYNDWLFDRNQFDALTFTSDITGWDKIRINPEMLMIHRLSNAAERRFNVSIAMMSGGPIVIADWPDDLGAYDRFYINEEINAIHLDNFVGQPMDNTPGSEGSNVWFGEMSDGDIIVGMFNRGDAIKKFDIPLSSLGLAGTYKVRDLWNHKDENNVDSNISASVARHDCKVIRLSDVNKSGVNESISDNNDMSAEVYDISGCRVNNTGNLEDLPSGIYIVRTGDKVSKIMK